MNPENYAAHCASGVIPVLNVPLVPQLLGAFVADHPAISVTVEEISSTEIETALEEGRMDVGLGFLTHHSPNLRYERLCTDQFALIVAQNHPWAKRAWSISGNYTSNACFNCPTAL